MNNWIPEKVCSKCGVSSEFYPSVSYMCKTCWKSRQQEWSLRINPETGLTNKKLTELRRRNIRLPKIREYRNVARQQVLFHYSEGTMQCKCCSEREPKFLALDHIDPVGRGIKGKTKDGEPRGGIGLYLKLIREGFPIGYRVLCHNCNLGRSINNGVCPHEELRSQAVA